MYKLIKKVMFQLQPESAHDVVETGLHYAQKLTPSLLSLLAKRFFVVDERLSQSLFGTTFAHPVGLGAGFDKNATMLKGLMALGFGHIEFGTITPKPQPGNPKPRLFRFPQEESIQNAMGFNNDGLEAIKDRLSNQYPFAIPLGANIGKNKTTLQENAIEDYRTLINGFNDLCDFMVVNISSPNTPGLRDLQNESFISELFSMAKEISKKPILLKIAPDMPLDTALSLCQCALDNGASGIVATNTTTDYSLLKGAKDFGGLSGKVLRKKSATFFRGLARVFYGKTTLISVGGIDSAQEAYARILEGASLVQVYSAFIFHGPSLNKNINEGILELMDRDGFHHISEAIGANR
jgi:dihydroorotate dehydrogenase